MKRVLFVDDEPRVVEGLRRKLRRYHNEWEMEFFSDPEAALARVREQPFDVVVSDMRMPRLSGTELLEKVREVSPQSVRVILSGQADASSIVKSAGPSHRFLSKPCGPEALQECLTRAFALRADLDDPNVLELVGGMESVPTLPALYRELQEAVRVEASLDEMGVIVAQDLGMTAKLLQLVNSAYFGLPRQVNDAGQAVKMLGTDTLTALVLGAKLFEAFPARDSAPLERIWQRSQDAASIARRICRQERVNDVVVAQTALAAFLHDIGLVALAARSPEAFARASALAPGPDLEEREQEQIQTTHATVGAYLLGLWGLPDGVVEAAAYHHNPRRAVASGLTPLVVVHVAQVLASGAAKAGAENGGDLDALARAGLDLEFLAEAGFEEQLPAWVQIGGGDAS